MNEPDAILLRHMLEAAETLLQFAVTDPERRCSATGPQG